MSIDPRLMERRTRVAEDHAKRNVGRLLKFLVAVTVLAGAVWLALSPWLSIAQVRTAGIVASDTNQTLAAHRVVAGTPMVMLRAGSIEATLEADPWVREARVHLNWPDEVIVRVEERVPAAWVETSGGWTRRAIDGVALPSAESPDDSLPWILLPAVDDREATDSRLVLGALQFASALPVGIHQGATIRREGEELWAVVAGFQVRLGRPVEMEPKALSLVALLARPLEEGSTIILIAPTHPAVSPPAR